MNKYALLGIAAFGGLVLITLVLPNGEEVPEESLTTETQAVVLPPRPLSPLSKD